MGGSSGGRLCGEGQAKTLAASWDARLGGRAVARGRKASMLDPSARTTASGGGRGEGQESAAWVASRGSRGGGQGISPGAGSGPGGGQGQQVVSPRAGSEELSPGSRAHRIGPRLQHGHSTPAALTLPEVSPAKGGADAGGERQGTAGARLGRERLQHPNMAGDLATEQEAVQTLVDYRQQLEQWEHEAQVRSSGTLSGLLLSCA